MNQDGSGLFDAQSNLEIKQFIGDIASSPQKGNGAQEWAKNGKSKNDNKKWKSDNLLVLEAGEGTSSRQPQLHQRSYQTLAETPMQAHVNRLYSTVFKKKEMIEKLAQKV